MKILLYNIADGCLDINNFELLVSYVRSESADIVVLLELNGWADDNNKILNTFVEKTAYPYFSFLKTNKDFNFAVFSKHKIESESSFLENFHHGLLKVSISSLNFLITHLNPYESSKRLIEIKKIIEQVDSSYPTIICGDLNSLSPHDSYDEENLLSMAKKKKIIKFGSTKIEYDSITILENSGFTDAYLLKNKTFKHTVPTLANKDSFHFSNLRLDYFFVNDLLKDAVKKIQIRQNSKTNVISDHYPVVLELNL